MNKICLSIVLLLLFIAMNAQHILEVKVLDAASGKPLSFASISPKGVSHGVTADSTGLAQLRMSAGKNSINVSHIG